MQAGRQRDLLNAFNVRAKMRGMLCGHNRHAFVMGCSLKKNLTVNKCVHVANKDEQLLKMVRSAMIR